MSDRVGTVVRSQTFTTATATAQQQPFPFERSTVQISCTNEKRSTAIKKKASMVKMVGEQYRDSDEKAFRFDPFYYKEGARESGRLSI